MDGGSSAFRSSSRGCRGFRSVFVRVFFKKLFVEGTGGAEGEGVRRDGERRGEDERREKMN